MSDVDEAPRIHATVQSREAPNGESVSLTVRGGPDDTLASVEAAFDRKWAKIMGERDEA